jgi:ATP-dependent Lon protease
VGVAPALVVSSAGGDVLPVEVSLTEPWGETPEIRMTGNVGEIMQESAWAAVTYVRARSAAWFDAPEFRHDVHIHLSEGAIRKDGPSAGLALVAALASALRGQTIMASSALTGEISLSGHVLPVGGVRDKLLAAEREGMRTVVIPRDNMDAVESLPKQVRSRLRVVPVRTIDEALRVVLPSHRRVPSTSSGRTSTS